MLIMKIICVLVLGLYRSCDGHVMQTELVYQSRHDYPGWGQNYQRKNNLNDQENIASGSTLKSRLEKHLESTTDLIKDLRESNHSSKSQNRSTRTLIRDDVAKNNQNIQEQNAIGVKSAQSSFKMSSLKLQRSYSHRKGRKGPLFIGTATNQMQNYDHELLKLGQNIPAHTFLEGKIQPDCCKITSNILFVRNSGSKSVNNGHSFKAPDYLPPLNKATTITNYNAPRYLPPKSTTRLPYLMNKITKHPFFTSTIPRQFHKTITTKIPYYVPILNQITATKQTHCQSCTSTSGPFYIPVTMPATHTTIPKVFETNDNEMSEYDPAKAMLVPAEEDDEMVNIILFPANTDRAQKGSPTEGNVELKENVPKDTLTTPNTFRPVDRVNERGDVPDEEDSTSLQPAVATSVPQADQYTSTAQMPLTNEQPILPSEIATITESTTITPLKMAIMNKTTTNASTATNKRVSTLPSLDINRHLMKVTDFTTQVYMSQKTSAFKGFEYLPSGDTKTKTVPLISTIEYPGPAPAMAMPVPSEPEDVPSSIPPAITKTTPTTSTIVTSLLTSTTKSDENRYQTAAVRKSSQKNTTPINITGPEYLPPKVSTTATLAVITTSSGVAPAMATPVPPEQDDINPASPPTSTSSSADSLRRIEAPHTTPSVPADANMFRGPKYLPPRELGPTLLPSPATAMQGPPEPDCYHDPNNNLNIDPRSVVEDKPCMPIKLKPKSKFEAPPYLPPLAKTRVQRSTNKTLRLIDLAETA